MTSHWETIGSPVASFEDLKAVMGQAYHLMQQYPEHCTFYPGDKVDYECLSVGGGAIEVWMRKDKSDGYYTMAYPHFFGSTRIPVQLKEAFDVGDTDISFLVYVNPKIEPRKLNPIYPKNNEPLELPNCSFQMVIAPPNSQHVIQKVNQDDIVTVQCTAFCESIQVFKDEAAYIASQKPIDFGERSRELMGGISTFKHKLNKPVYLGSKMFIAPDLMSSEEDDDNAPSPKAFITGQIVSINHGPNPLTQQNIYYGMIQTADDIPFDVVIADKDVESIKVGNIITGTFWISSRFIFEE